jgi:hypothetical protein
MFGKPLAFSFPKIYEGAVPNVLTMGSQIWEAELKLYTRRIGLANL